MRKKFNHDVLFWNVDTQYDLMSPDGGFYIKGAEKIRPNLQKLTDFAKQKNIQVVNTGNLHPESSERISHEPDYNSTFPPHCIENTFGAEFILETFPRHSYKIDWTDSDFDEFEVLKNRNIVLYKDGFDVFSDSLHVDRVLDVISPEKVVVYGVPANYSVNDAVNGLLDRDVRVCVAKDAMKETPDGGIPYDLWDGVIVEPTEEIIKMLKED